MQLGVADQKLPLGDTTKAKQELLSAEVDGAQNLAGSNTSTKNNRGSLVHSPRSNLLVETGEVHQSVSNLPGTSHLETPRSGYVLPIFKLGADRAAAVTARCT